MTALASWTVDQSQQCNLDIGLSGVLRAPPSPVVPAGVPIVNLRRVSEVYPAPTIDPATGMPAIPGAIAITVPLLLAGGLDGITNRGLATSPDGAAWTEQAFPGGIVSHQINAVGYHDGLFVAGTQHGELLTSTDGTTWTLRSNPLVGGRIQCLAYGGGKWLAGGFDGAHGHALISSADGITWTLVACPFDTGDVNGLAYSGSLWVMVGYDNGAHNETVASSPDGSTWTRRGSPFDQNGAIGDGFAFKVAWCQSLGIWAAFGSNDDSSRAIMTSPDGASWTARSSPFDNSGDPVGNIASDGNIFVATGDGPSGNPYCVARSADGVTWTGISTPVDGSDRCSAVCWSPELSLWIVANQPSGANPALVITSADAFTWASHSDVLGLALDVTSGHLGHPSTRWMPSGVIDEEWGRWQIVVGGVDVTFFRGHATQLGTMIWNEPFGDDTIDVIFGMIGPFEQPGAGDLAWMVDGADVEIYHVLPNGTVDIDAPMFEGRVLARDIVSGGRSGAGSSGQGEGADSGSFSRTLHCLGAIYAADLLIKTPSPTLAVVTDPVTGQQVAAGVDVGELIADEINARVAGATVHLSAMTVVETGIQLSARGSGTQLVNGYFQDLLGQASVAPLPAVGVPNAVVMIVRRPDGAGYWLAAQDGTVVAFGTRTFYGGSMAGRALIAAISGMAGTPTGLGYWLCAEDGGVFAFGDAQFWGEEPTPVGTIIAMSATPTGLGYWLLSDAGDVYTFGDASYHGNATLTGGHVSVGIAGTPDGGGYWIVDNAGDVFALGDATYEGNATVATPAVGLAPTITALGYWIVDDAGQVYALGDAVWHGNTPSPINAPACAIQRTPSGLGYWIAAQDGGVFSFGDAQFYGSIPGNGGQWQAWTVAKLSGRQPVVRLKDRWTAHATVRVGQPGVDISLQWDRTMSTNVIYGDGTDDNGHQWRNTKYPRLNPVTPPIYPGSPLHLGQTSADVLTWTQQMHDAGWAITPSTTFDTVAQRVCQTFQLANGLELTGTVNAQTWAATFVIGADNGDLTGAYIAPVAEVPEVEPFLYDPYGGRKGPGGPDNPNFDATLPRVERWETFGEHVARASAQVSALAELARDSTPGLVGTVTLTADPNEKSRYDLRAGMNLLLQGIEGRDVLLHIAQASVAWNSQGRPVTLTVDEHARDLITVAAVRNRDRSTTDPVRRQRHSRRASRILADRAIPWDFEAGGGIIPAFVLDAGLWSVVRIPAAEAGTVVEIDLTTVSPASPFAVAIFNQPVTPAAIKAVVANPLASSEWATSIPAIMGMVIGWGQQGDACGYTPGTENEGAAPTGVFTELGSWQFQSLIPPWLWVALYSPIQCTISGRLYPEPVIPQ